MKLVENLSAKVQEQAEEIQRLRDENNRLKGEQGKPKIKANKPTTNLSSEKERRESQPHHKESKQAEIRIDRVEVVKVDHQRLPQDAKFKGYEEVVVQDIEICPENIKFGHPRNTTPQAIGKRIWPISRQATKVSLDQESELGYWHSTTRAG